MKVYTCQPDHVFNHLGETHLWVRTTVSSERVEWGGKTYLECSSTILWAGLLE